MILKFRIFDKKKKRFLDDFTMEIDRYGIHVLDELNYVVDEDDRVLMQSTGLTDIGEDEVFEGDIVYDDYYELYGFVKYDEGSFVLEWDGVIEPLSERINTLPVVGNIHEHPELLN
ncbi:YopX family protein [Macrococcus psychrotolerans]|uniref:YopX family protein n=1 Tax=Macrococcus psychrotolerans TaxID=3039389 RepID=A0AAT9P0H5_9STAP|nr:MULTISPECIES: YopX family protein [Macrococcus]QYA32003.1 YopX family protein [Macrococcus sp. 19Msa1099]QYA36809.1 YopX family protein [Macrococcus caseolyticus]QYA75517.1 YopX family protein [Macrococcus caseolyticus]